MIKKLHLLTLFIFAAFAPKAFAGEYIYEFSGKEFTAAGQQTLNGVTWILQSDAGYYGSDAVKGQQIGSKANPGKNITLTTSGIQGTINEITITTSGASSIDATLTVSVGNVTYGTPYQLTTESTAATFTGNSSGEIKLYYSQNSSKAIYIKSIKVFTDGTTPPVVQPTTIPTVKSIAELNALDDNTEAMLYLSDEAQARVTFVYGQNAYIRDNSGAVCFYGFAKNPTMKYNQHIAGYITGKKTKVGNLPVLTATAKTNTTMLAIADPVTEPDVAPIVITAAEQTKHYADWVIIKGITMTNATNGNDGTGDVVVVNTFNSSKFTIPEAGKAYDISGIVNSTASSGDRLSPVYNVTLERSANPDIKGGTEFQAIVTGIEQINAVKKNENAVIYDMMGRRVYSTQNLRGIYIINGKKVVK